MKKIAAIYLVLFGSVAVASGYQEVGKICLPEIVIVQEDSYDNIQALEISPLSEFQEVKKISLPVSVVKDNLVTYDEIRDSFKQSLTEFFKDQKRLENNTIETIYQTIFDNFLKTKIGQIYSLQISQSQKKILYDNILYTIYLDELEKRDLIFFDRRTQNK